MARKPMSAGQLDRRITIEQETETVSPSGGVVVTWATVATVWAAKMDVRPRERYAAATDLATETTTFRIRWRSGITPEMRITYDGKVYNIEGIAEVGRRIALDLTATARVA